jgi:hypothetical protein
MKFIHIFLHDLKTKTSTKLLVALLLIIIGSSFMSNILLKDEFDISQKMPKNPFKDYQKIVAQPFSHMVIDSGNLVNNIQIESGDASVVYIHGKKLNLSQWQEHFRVTNDTLFLRFSNDAKIKSGGFRLRDKSKPFIQIVSPNVQSISLNQSQCEIVKFNQKSLIIKGFDNSRISLSDNIDSLDLLDVKLKASSLSFTDEHSGKKVNIKKLDADISDHCDFDLSQADIKAFKLKDTDDNSWIRLSSKTIGNLLKKNLSKGDLNIE